MTAILKIRASMNAFCCFTLIALYFKFTTAAVSGLTCLNEKSQPVDWFIIYKLPIIYDDGPTTDGTAYFYMDAQNPSWFESDKKITDGNTAVANTLNQVYKSYKNKEMLYVLYNDEPPVGPEHRFGHSKGVLASDQTSGFWLVHSVPKFPNCANSSYEYPENGKKNGQTFLCISLPYKSMDTVGTLLYYNHPSIYDSLLPEQFVSDNPKLEAVIHSKHATGATCKFITPLYSLKNIEFTAFAKSKDFEKDLYADLVSTYTRSSLFVESWQNGGAAKLNSSCSQTYKVYNVKEVLVGKYLFTETKDHSKWATGYSKPITCIGDINRQESQEHRGGGTVCFENRFVHSSFFKAVKNYEKCP